MIEEKVLKVELHVCNSPKDTGYLYYNKYYSTTDKKDIILTICNSRSVLSTLDKVMIFCTVERIEYYYGHEFNTIVYHDSILSMVSETVFQKMLSTERR